MTSNTSSAIIALLCLQITSPEYKIFLLHTYVRNDGTIILYNKRIMPRLLLSKQDSGVLHACDL